MQFCPYCNKPVRYIAIPKNVMLCEADETIVYTEFGRKVKGWQPHKCQEEKNGEENRS